MRFIRCGFQGKIVVNQQRANCRFTLRSGFRGNHNVCAVISPLANILAKIINQRGASIHLWRTGNAVCALVFLQPLLINGCCLFAVIAARKLTSFPS